MGGIRNQISIGIKRAIHNEGLTQKEFADDIHVSYQTVKNWTCGRYIPRIDDLEMMCDYFKCDLDYLLMRAECKTRDVQGVCDYTGLSESAVEILHSYKRYKKYQQAEQTMLDTLNELLTESVAEDSFLRSLSAYLFFWKPAEYRYSVYGNFIDVDNLLPNNASAPVQSSDNPLEEIIYNVCNKINIDKELMLKKLQLGAMDMIKENYSFLPLIEIGDDELFLEALYNITAERMRALRKRLGDKDD